MKISEKIKTFIKNLPLALKQPEEEYEYAHDIAQKTIFVITLLVLFLFRLVNAPMMFLVFCSIGGGLVLPAIELWFEDRKFVKERTSQKRFLNMSDKLWKVIVLVTLLAITTYDIIHNFEFFAIPGYIIVNFIAFFVYAGVTNVVHRPSNPSEVGSGAWMDEMQLKPVSGSGDKHLYRDKNGNYWTRGAAKWHPAPAPVEVVNKSRK